MSNSPCIFIIEPDAKLVHPYDILSQLYSSTVELIRYQTLNQAEENILLLAPKLVLVSGSFSPVKSVEFLEHLKNTFVDQLIPVIVVVDWSQHVSRIVGTHWGNKIGLLHTLSSPAEVRATIERLQPRLSAISE